MTHNGMSSFPLCKKCAQVRTVHDVCNTCQEDHRTMTHNEATVIIRRAAAVLLRVSADYQAEGLTGVADELLQQAVDLHHVVSVMDAQRSVTWSDLPSQRPR